MANEPREVVLLVEDEPMVRCLAFDGLQAEGYEVLEAENAAAAMRLLRERTDVAVLFTDVNMPGPMDGLALAELVHDRWPDIRLVVTSGRSVERPVPDDGAFLPKPYSVGDMAAAVRAGGSRQPTRLVR